MTRHKTSGTHRVLTVDETVIAIAKHLPAGMHGPTLKALITAIAEHLVERERERALLACLPDIKIGRQDAEPLRCSMCGGKGSLSPGTACDACAGTGWAG